MKTSEVLFASPVQAIRITDTIDIMKTADIMTADMQE